LVFFQTSSYHNSIFFEEEHLKTKNYENINWKGYLACTSCPSAMSELPTFSLSIAAQAAIVPWSVQSLGGGTKISHGSTRLEHKVSNRDRNSLLAATPPTTHQIDDLGVSELEKLMTDDSVETEANIKENEGTLNGVDMDISDGINENNENNENNKNNENRAGEKEETNYDEEKKMVIDSPLDNKIDQNIETCSSIDNENDIDLDIDVEEQLTPATTESSDIEKTLAGEEHQQELIPNNSKTENDVAQTMEKNYEDDTVSLVLEDPCQETPSRPQSVTSISSMTTPRPQSGLQMIVSNYCSSDEEL